MDTRATPRISILWIGLSPDDADNAIKALEEFGFESAGLKKEDFLEKDQVIQIGYPPNRIDLLTTLREITFEDCYKKIVKCKIQGVKINFIDLGNLKQNKRATGRTQDLADAENLEYPPQCSEIGLPQLIPYSYKSYTIVR
jgi:hypothetical protein